MSKIKQLLDRERETAEALRRSLSEIKALEAFLPICAECKKIRNEQGTWQQLEAYIGQHSNTQFSHGYCPECATKAMEEAGLIRRKSEPCGPPDSSPGAGPETATSNARAEDANSLTLHIWLVGFS